MNKGFISLRFEDNHCRITLKGWKSGNFQGLKSWKTVKLWWQKSWKSGNYDRKKVGEVDYLIDDYDSLNVLPIEIKSGKDYKNFRALPKIIMDSNYKMEKGYVLSNEREMITFYPIYFIMFL